MMGLAHEQAMDAHDPHFGGFVNALMAFTGMMYPWYEDGLEEEAKRALKIRIKEVLRTSRQYRDLEGCPALFPRIQLDSQFLMSKDFIRTTLVSLFQDTSMHDHVDDFLATKLTINNPLLIKSSPKSMSMPVPLVAPPDVEEAPKRKTHTRSDRDDGKNGQEASGGEEKKDRRKVKLKPNDLRISLKNNKKKSEKETKEGADFPSARVSDRMRARVGAPKGVDIEDMGPDPVAHVNEDEADPESDQSEG